MDRERTALPIRPGVVHASSSVSASHAAARRYWAFLANPSMYRIEEAIACLRSDWWKTKDRPVRVGDRVVIWRAQDRPHDLRRGVVALGEVIGGPEVRSDAVNPYWAVTPSDTPEERVRIRYVVPPNLPLWLDGPADVALRELSVSRGQGTIFNVSSEQWDAIVEAAGGWQDDPPEVRVTLDVIDEMAGRRTSDQGFTTSAETRRAIERHAMERASSYYAARGWRVEDVSATSPYDLRCVHAEGRELRVEVKGTTGDGSQVLLTAGEVRHAHIHAPDVALFVLAGVELEDASGNATLASGGIEMVYEPWVLEEEDLSAIAYTYRPPGHSRV